MLRVFYDPILATAFYGFWALFALIGTWGKESKSQVGVVMFACWVASNVIFWSFPVEMRPALLPILDVIFALSAAKAGKELDSRIPLVLIALSVAAIAINTAFSISGAGSIAQVNIYEISLNIVFVLQCAITGGWGMADALGRLFDFRYRADRLRRGTQYLRDPAED